MDNYRPVLTYAAGSQMLKWELMDSHLHRDNRVVRGSSINVFISLEAVLKNLTTVKDLGSLVSLHKQDVVLDLESSILNLVANYKSYFNREGCPTRIFLYMTDLDECDQSMKAYNEFYRSYYYNHYRRNPGYRAIGDLLVETILPEIELILTYVPDCYMVRSKRFDGSLVPDIIQKCYPAERCIIITSDVFDTLYSFRDGFTVIYIKRRYANFRVVSDVEESIQGIVTGESPFDTQLFMSEMYYKLLLSIRGSDIRNIRSAKGFGYGKFLSLLKEGVNHGIVLKDFSSIESVIELFPDKYRNDIKMAFQCTDLDIQLSLLGESDYDFVRSKIVDRVDRESLEALNNKRFSEYPINLLGLLS